MVKPGDDGAPKVFANALSDVAPATFAKALQKGSKFIYKTFHEDPEISAFEARHHIQTIRRWQQNARYQRLQMASGAPNTGPA